MKVAFPLRNKTELAIDFVRCYSIGVYDDTSKQIEYLQYNVKEGYDPEKLCETIRLSGADCVVSPSFSCSILKELEQNNIKTYKAQGEAVEGNIKRLFSKMLHLFDIFDALHPDDCPIGCVACKL